MIKKSLVACALTMALLAPSCLGPNNAYNSLSDWNAEVTDMNWLNEVTFIAISPVYVLAGIGDVVIFNTMAYWGSNPFGAPGEFPKSFTSSGQ